MKVIYTGRCGFSVVLLRSAYHLIAACFTLCCGPAGPVLAETPYSNPNTAEG